MVLGLMMACVVPAAAEERIADAVFSSLFSPQQSSAAASNGPDTDHLFGVGIRIGGSNFGFGGTVRYFLMGPWGVQGEVSRYGFGALGYDYSSTQFNGEVLYRLKEIVLEAPVKLQPYVGGGISFIHTSFPSVTVLGTVINGASDNSAGVVITGGVEVFFEKVPKLGVSGAFEFTSNGDFNSVAIGGPAFLAAAHYYLNK
jgi:hypothetical protein